MNYPEVSPSIISAFQRKDLIAFQKIYELYFSFIYKVILRLVRNPEIAEDLVQDIFIKIYDNRKKYDLNRSFSTWLYQVAVHHTLNYLKRERLFNTRLVVELFSYQKHTQPFIDTVEKAEEKNRILNLFHQLPRDYQISLIFRDIEGFSYEKIAEILKLNLNTLKTRIHRAREMLADLYRHQKEGGYPCETDSFESVVLVPQIT